MVMSSSRAQRTHRSDERAVERVWEVGGGDDGDSAVLLEAVHLHQQLVQSHLRGGLVLQLPEKGEETAIGR